MQRGLPTSATLVIEVAVSSAAYDLGIKAELYSRTGVPEYWVVDLSAERVVVHRGPAASLRRRVRAVCYIALGR